MVFGPEQRERERMEAMLQEARVIALSTRLASDVLRRDPVMAPPDSQDWWQRVGMGHM